MSVFLLSECVLLVLLLLSQHALLSRSLTHSLARSLARISRHNRANAFRSSSNDDSDEEENPDDYDYFYSASVPEYLAPLGKDSKQDPLRKSGGLNLPWHGVVHPSSADAPSSTPSIAPFLVCKPAVCSLKTRLFSTELGVRWHSGRLFVKLTAANCPPLTTQAE